jgi:hypothetical protein
MNPPITSMPRAGETKHEKTSNSRVSDIIPHPACRLPRSRYGSILFLSLIPSYCRHDEKVFGIMKSGAGIGKECEEID